MTAYVIRRVWQMIPTIFGVIASGVIFCLTRMETRVAARAISGDGDTRRLGPRWKRAVPDNGKRGVHLGERQGATVPGEGVGHVGRALLIALLLEDGGVGASLEEVHVRPFQVAQRLLDRDGGHLGQQWVLLLHGRQQRC